MKKLFLLFGMAAFTDACAQQNELFDIQKKVKEKIAADRKAIGRQVRLLPFQQSLRVNNPTPLSTDITYLLSNGDKMVLLGQDNMPCIKTDMRLYQRMPNAASNNHCSENSGQDITIPNAAIPLKRF